MVSQPQVAGSRHPGTDPEALFDFLDYLRAQSFKVAADEYALVQNLMLILVALGEDVSDAKVLKKYLAPVLCTTSREQANFPAIFDRWLSGGRPASVSQDSREVRHELRNTEALWQKWRWIIAGVALTIATAVVWSVLKPAPLPRADGLDRDFVLAAHLARAHRIRLLLNGATFLALTALAWGAWWFFRARLFLKRRSTTEQPDLLTVSLDTKLNQHYDPTFLRRAAGELRRRYPAPSSELAVEATIEQTLHNSGEFTPVYRSRLVAPEYLLLIDRKGFRDHNAHLVGELIERLESDQVQIQQFYFDRDPRTVYPASARASPVALRDLLAKYNDSRILLFTEGEGLFDAATGELETWADLLWRRSHIAVLTSKTQESWGHREHVLAELALVMPATAEGIVNFAKACNGIRSPDLRVLASHGPFPHELAERPDRWLERDAPDATLVMEVLQAVRRFLGEETYFWLAACAAYPAVNFNLTIYLGTNLRDAAGQSLFTSERAVALFRLPWLQKGYLPDWLRVQLLSELSPEQSSAIREVLNRLWLSVATGSTKAIDLEIARNYPNALASLGRTVYRKLKRSSPPDSTLRDHVFASVMLGRSLSPLAVRIPRFWSRLLTRRKNRKPKPGEVAVVQEWSAKERLAAAAAYLTPIPAVVFLFIRPLKRRLLIRFHSYQSLYLALALIGLDSSKSILLVAAEAVEGSIRTLLTVEPSRPGTSPVFFVLLAISGLCDLIVYVCWFYLIVASLRGRMPKVPLVGKWAQRSAEKWGAPRTNYLTLLELDNSVGSHLN
jgi:uncharacterized membrane protein